MLRWFKADLHIHTVLSACAELTMGPADIIRTAEKNRLDMIAITDHNSVENVHAVSKAAAHTRVNVIAGMEVATTEKVHLICLFPGLEKSLAFQHEVYDHLHQGHYNEELYGPQIICDHYENIIDKSTRLLMHGIHAPIPQVIKWVHACNGIIYPAHIDRKAYSIYRNYTNLPADLGFSAVEISRNIDAEQAMQLHPDIKSYPIIVASDAHDIQDIGKSITYFRMHSPTFSELRLALEHKGGRAVSTQFVKDSKETL